MSFSKAVINDNICLADPAGNCIWLCVSEDDARLLGFEMPGTEHTSEEYTALLQAAETEAFNNGKKRIICDIPSSDDHACDALKEAGYEMTEADNVIYVKTNELLSSTGVEKSLRMKFPNVEAICFSDLMSFQREEVRVFLNKFRFPADNERFERINPDISVVAYDDKYELCAVLLASCKNSEIIVELLFGFSAKKPQYVLAVCQKFVEGIKEHNMQGEYPRISMLTINSNVVPLLKRLLNKEYRLESAATVFHAEKEVKAGDVQIAEGGFEPGGNIELTSQYQNNINEKYAWSMRKKG